MMTYEFLQHYWCAVVALLAALLVFLMFVQGANSQIFELGKTADERRLLINSTGRKWEFTFTTLVTFGGAFFASYPLFYSTSFGGAYWLWMLILFSFVLQAVSYEFQNKLGNLLGTRTFQAFLVLNGILGPVLLGGAVATFFDGSNFIIDRDNITSDLSPIVSRWANASHGLDALLDVWNVVFGLAVLFLARLLGNLYTYNNIEDAVLARRNLSALWKNTAVFLVLFLAFFFHIMTKDGFAYDSATGIVSMEPEKYFHNLFGSVPLLAMFLLGVIAVLLGVVGTYGWKSKDGTAFRGGIWLAGIGTVMVVVSLLLTTAYFNTCYYPSNADLQSSLTMQNSCSSEFTLRTMFYVSLLVPFVLAYIWYAWRKMDQKRLTHAEVQDHESEAY
ncbi:MAG: cytochrome d ubiquinol oxidase subunit II [Bacteroidaceae bacterium]|nr:cytochrome d ubiquinol oxidase subunit II [Bacteroidaceae bacterium]